MLGAGNQFWAQCIKVLPPQPALSVDWKLMPKVGAGLRMLPLFRWGVGLAEDKACRLQV